MSGVRINKYRVESIRTKEQKDDFIRWLIARVDEMPRGIPNMPASQWIEQNIVIVEGDYQGPYSFKLTPYLREIADRMSIRSLTQEIAIIKSNQLGMSMLSFALMCYFVYYGVGPMLFVSGDATMAEESFEKRLDPMLESSGLRHLIKPMVKKTGGARATGDTKGSKSYGGTSMRAAGPNSEGPLRSFPGKILIVEEIDIYPQTLKGKGNPIEKAVRRTDTFGVNKRIYYNSTPKEKATSQILPLYEAGTMSQYTWECPECGYRQSFVWSGFAWDSNEDGSPKIDIDENGQVTKDPVYYKCQNPAGCSRTIQEHEKYKLMLDRTMGGTAEYTPMKRPDRPGLWSCKVPSFYSPTRSWLDIILQYWRVKDDPILYPDFVNDSLAECSESYVRIPDAHFLMSRREKWWSRADATLPSGVVFTVLTCDVQADRLECSLIGFGSNVQSWVCGYWVLPGDTGSVDDVCWQNLAAKIETEYARTDGVVLGTPVVSFIDAGYNAPEVKKFCSQYRYRPGRVNGVYPIIGRDENIAKGRNYKILPVDYGTPEIMINDQYYKLLVYHYVDKEQQGDSYPRGYIHFPSDLEESYFKQLTAEEVTEDTTRTGRKVRKVTNVKGRRNEALDLMKMGYAALQFMCGEYYGAINKKRKANHKAEVAIDLDRFIEVMDAGNGTEGEEGA